MKSACICRSLPWGLLSSPGTTVQLSPPVFPGRVQLGSAFVSANTPSNLPTPLLGTVCGTTLWRSVCVEGRGVAGSAWHIVEQGPSASSLPNLRVGIILHQVLQPEGHDCPLPPPHLPTWAGNAGWTTGTTSPQQLVNLVPPQALSWLGWTSVPPPQIMLRDPHATASRGTPWSLSMTGFQGKHTFHHLLPTPDRHLCLTDDMAAGGRCACWEANHGWLQPL